MNITLRMTIQDQTFDLNLDMTMKAGRIYRQHFNRDLVKDMSDIYRTVNGSVYNDIDMSKVETEGKTDEEIAKQLLSQAVPLYLAHRNNTDLSYEDTERVYQILWAFVKNADEKLSGYEEWIDGFDFILPAKDLITMMYSAWNDSAQPTIELKN